MKQLFLALLAVGSIATANAQKGTILVYGNTHVSVRNDDNGSVSGERSFTNWGVHPGVGYQFHKNLTVGVQGGYGYREDVTKRPFLTLPSLTTQSEVYEWSVGPFLRYTHYFSPMFALWGQLDMNYVSGRSSMDSIGTTSIKRVGYDHNGFSTMITPALAINVHNGLALNFGIGGIGYKTLNAEAAGPDRISNEFMFTFGQQINVGISKNFNCAKKRAPREPGMDTRGHKHDHDDDEDDE
jgi:hypothetical protein